MIKLKNIVESSKIGKDKGSDSLPNSRAKEFRKFHSRSLKSDIKERIY